MMYEYEYPRKGTYMKESFSTIKKSIIKAAKELKYDEEELTSIMTKARKRKE